MGLFTRFSPESSPTWLITLKVCGHTLSFNVSLTLWTHRALIATIHDMGQCPCPWCTIKKEGFSALSTTNDAENHQINWRCNNDNFWVTVQKVRDNIYQDGYAISSGPGVEWLLKEESLVPTLVSCLVVLWVLMIWPYARMHFHILSMTRNSIFSAH